MSLVYQRIGFSLVTLLWGVVLTYFYGSGRIARYLDPSFHPWTLFGGLGLCVLGAFTLLTAREGEAGSCGHDHDHGDGEDCDHNHEASEMDPTIAMVFAVFPLLATLWFTQDEMSSEGIERKGLYSAEAAPASFFEELPPYTREYLEETRAKTADGFFEMQLLEVYFGTDNEEMRGVLNGLPIAVEGRVMPERVNNEDGRRLRLFRLMRNCCAADSRVIPLVLEFSGEVPEIVPKEWAIVKGELVFEDVAGRKLPLLKVGKFEKGDLPKDEAMGRDFPGF